MSQDKYSAKEKTYYYESSTEYLFFVLVMIMVLLVSGCERKVNKGNTNPSEPAHTVIAPPAVHPQSTSTPTANVDVTAIAPPTIRATGRATAIVPPAVTATGKPRTK